MGVAMIPFDNRNGVIWLDGKFVPWREAKIHSLTHGLHYASCVFEGERAYNGKIFKLTEHSERLKKSARILGFEIPYTVEELNIATKETMRNMGFANCYIRPFAWRGSEQMSVSAHNTKIHVGIAAWEWANYFQPEAISKGVRLSIASWTRPHPSSAPTESKASGLYMISTLAKHEAESRGYGDALMLDWRGQIAEASAANIFLVINGELHTPIPDCFLNGITRQIVFEMARARNINVIERVIMPEELANASEVFLCGTAAEISPVSEIDQYKFIPGIICRMFVEDYTKLVYQ
jgi:branched-chain amino acid aminotransferase